MIIHYKCLNCGANMVFDAETASLHCDSCGRNDKVEGFPEENIDRQFSESDGKEYHCENCGAVLLTDDDTTATTCSFCGAAMVIADRLSGVMAPAKIIPFKISKEKAQDAFRKWCGDGKLTPKDFMTADRIKNISGMYIPFWLYDLNTRVKAKGKGKKISSYRRGDYNYTETRHYDIYRDLDLHYIKVPADASLKMHDELMDTIEPYNYSDMDEFKTPYLAGYIAEKYNYTETEMLPRVKSKVEGYVDTYLRNTAYSYDIVSFNYKNIDTKNKHAYYTLLPVWMVYYDYNGEEYIFAMNGQTGKVVGKPPISRGRTIKRFLLTGLGSFIVIKLLIMLILGGGLW